MHHYFLFFLLAILFDTIENAAVYPNSYTDVNSKARESIRRLADILDQEMASRRFADSYYNVYPQRMMPSLPLTILPLPAKRLHRIGGNIVMG